MKTIRLYICDDEEYWGDIFSKAVASIDDFEVAGFATDSEHMLNELKESGANVLLLDINMKYKYEGVSLIPDILKQCPDMKIIMLTGYDDEKCIFDCFSAGAKDYLTKDMPIDKMIQTIRATCNNESAVRQEIISKLLAGAKLEPVKDISLLWAIHRLTKLSKAEFEMLIDVYNGTSYSEIAKKRVVEPQSVRMMASRILSKFDMDSMDDLIAALKTINAIDIFKRL